MTNRLPSWWLGRAGTNAKFARAVIFLWPTLFTRQWLLFIETGIDRGLGPFYRPSTKIA
jgi:hypothetical protein